MSGVWYVAVALVGVAAGVLAWVVVDLRARAADLAGDAERFRALQREAAALGIDVRRLRARLATVEARAASGRRRVDG
jgi:hypothetical protein